MEKYLMFFGNRSFIVDEKEKTVLEIPRPTVTNKEYDGLEAKEVNNLFGWEKVLDSFKGFTFTEFSRVDKFPREYEKPYVVGE